MQCPFSQIRTLDGLFLPNILITWRAAALFCPWEIANCRSWAIVSPQSCVYVVGVISCKGLITLELAGCTKEHKNLKPCDKNINLRGFALKVDNTLVFIRILKAADYECFLCKTQPPFFIQCILKRIKLSPGYLAVPVCLLLLCESPRQGGWRWGCSAVRKKLSFPGPCLGRSASESQARQLTEQVILITPGCGASCPR